MIGDILTADTKTVNSNRVAVRLVLASKPVFAGDCLHEQPVRADLHDPRASLLP